MRTVHSVLAVYALLACSTFASAQTSFRQTLPIKASGREASVKQLEAIIQGQGAYMTSEADRRQGSAERFKRRMGAKAPTLHS